MIDAQHLPLPPTGSEKRPPRIAIFIVAYNAVTTLARVLDRIPQSVRDAVEEVYVFDDASPDDTYLLARGYQEVHGWAKLKIFRNEQNQGYGGNQKLGYQYAIERGFDYVVLLHGDGQYAPEVMSGLLEPLVQGRADAVFGSRMMERGAARAGGMPFYKFVGNRILTAFQNRLAGVALSEWHSGYRAYSVKALAQLPLTENTNDFHFDTEIILELLDRGYRIEEVPIPVYYGDEICRVNGMRYAGDVARTAIRHRLHRAGARSDPRFHAVRYPAKSGPYSSHSRIMDGIPHGARVLDLGCEPEVASRFQDRGCSVVGVGFDAEPCGAERLEAWHRRDLERGIDLPGEEGSFDVVILGDVIEHLRNGTGLMSQAARYLREGGHMIVSTANVAFFPIRLGLLFGRFQYTPRGILDETHTHLYTRKTFLTAIRRAGFAIRRVRYAPPPLEAVLPAFSRTAAGRFLDWCAKTAATVLPGLFAFQFVVEAVPHSGERDEQQWSESIVVETTGGDVGVRRSPLRRTG